MAEANANPETYRPIPVDEARRIAGQYLKDWVILLAYDGEFDRTHATTFGYGAGTKSLTADLADVCLRAIGICLDERVTHEDFRLVPAAEAAREIADLRTKVEALEAMLRESEGSKDL